MHRRNLTPSQFSTFLWLFSSASSAGSCSWWEKVWELMVRPLSVEYPTAMVQYDYHSLKGPWLVELVDLKSIQLFLSLWHNVCKSCWLAESLVKPEGDFSYVIFLMACSGWWDGELHHSNVRYVFIGQCFRHSSYILNVGELPDWLKPPPSCLADDQSEKLFFSFYFFREKKTTPTSG